MKKIEAIIRPEKLREVIEALRAVEVTGFTVTQAQGRGQQKNLTGVYRGKTYTVNLHHKVKMEIVVSDHKVKETIRTIIGTAQTGEMGDGKIFVLPVEEMYNIRTGRPDDTIDELL
ncbi:P-II family nitrogen regulator [Paenibacillus spiritus]|uniref:P-II family nitrogen regulator n=1 Tax=Paenibacillus spiritus TaxID=2496557 RepID=A0A5J5GF05_9BACL|nr:MULTISPECIES: P-II family nitrogen regulator [Paenibacillus]KAA9006343.1 P-II family nitrogen regulator [Paenibacillus spiritus]